MLELFCNPDSSTGGGCGYGFLGDTGIAFGHGDGHYCGYNTVAVRGLTLEDPYGYHRAGKMLSGAGYGAGPWTLDCLHEILPMLCACEIGRDLACMTRLAGC